MKFVVTLKDPDVLHNAIREAVRLEVSTLALSDDGEREAVAELRAEKVHALCGTWFRYGEYLTVEVDTEAKTCVVVKERDRP